MNKIPINTDYIKAAVEYLTPECKSHYVYGMLAVCETLEGYVDSLTLAMKDAGLYRQQIAWLCRNIDGDFRRYKVSLLDLGGGKRVRDALERALELLNEEYKGYMHGLYRTIDQAALSAGFPSEISKCLANASMVNVLAQYVRFNDNKLSKALEKITLTRVQLGDPNINLIEKRSSKVIDQIDKLCPKWKVDLNQIEAVQLAVKVIDVQLGRVMEVIEKLNEEREASDIPGGGGEC